MSKFINNPIKLNILNKDGDIANKYIFIGDVNFKIRKTLQDIQKTNKVREPQRKILSKFYGKNWKSILGLTNIEGGQEITLEELEELSMPEKSPLEEIPREEPAEISLEELESIDKISHVEEPRVSKIPQKAAKINFIFDEAVLYPIDTIMEFKRKVSVVTKIPIYKQNIWYDFNNNKYNLNYNILISRNHETRIVNPTIMDNIIGKKIEETIAGIPILIDYYNVKNLIKVKAYDEFSILEEIVDNTAQNEFNLFNMDEFIHLEKLAHEVGADKNQAEIIYYGFILLFWPMLSLSSWIDYLETSGENFEKIYPDLSLNLDSTRKMFDIEKKITNHALHILHDKETTKMRKDIENNLFISITNSILQVISPVERGIVNLRNLFDKIELDGDWIACKCSTVRDGRNIIFSKTYLDNTPITRNIPLKCTALRRRLDDINNLDLLVFPNGSYIIRAKWPEEKQYGFDQVLKIVMEIVNPMIAQINTFSGVVDTNYSLQRMIESNTRFSEVYVSFLYRKQLRFVEFKTIQNIMQDYLKAGIVRLNNIEEATNTLEYYFSKGMYKYDSNRIEKIIILSNYYSYLTNAVIKNRWQQLYQIGRSTRFLYRNGDLKITIEGIKSQEFATFYMYIINIFATLATQARHYAPKRHIEEVRREKNIKTLKTLDPLLYDFKKIYNSPMIYSKICQKKFQPTILTEDEYRELSDEEKKRVVDYWNFTTKTPAKYYCPNPKFPHIQFTVKRHPRDYCIPCCKIKPIDKSTSNLKKIIYDTCLKDFEYGEEKRKIVEDTRYIISYGKLITPGRLMSLPEETIDPLFRNATMKTTVKTCDMYFYILGLEQMYRHIENIGFISSLAFSLDITVRDLIEETIRRIKKQPEKFRILLDGKIVKYFRDCNDMLKNLYDTFIGELSNTVKWDDIFIDIAYYYFDVLAIIFEDKSTVSYENVELAISNRLKYKNIDKHKRTKNLLLIHRGDLYLPIFYFNPTTFFKTGFVEHKLYKDDDPIIKLIMKMIEFYNDRKLIESTEQKITLDVYHQFANSTRKYLITKYFINSDNKCYYIEFTRNNRKIYVPVRFSSYTNSVDAEYSYFRISKYKTSFMDLNEFIKDVNRWIATESYNRGLKVPGVEKYLPIEQQVIPIYEYIKIDKWLYLDNLWDKKEGVVIGFIHDNINYYCEALKINTANKIKKAPMERLLYHPDSINENTQKDKIVADNRVKNITRNLYDYYIYELLLIEFINMLHKEKNIEVRHKIKKQIIKLIDSESTKMLDEITNILKNYYGDTADHDLYDDYSKLTEQINDYIVNHKDRKLLLKQIDETFYKFDQMKINELRSMNKKELLTELKRIMPKIVINAKVDTILKNPGEFPNMLLPCDANQQIYCKDKKLVIEKKKLEELLEILASDILNPFKQKFLFSLAFVDNVINYFKFEKRKDENIIIFM